MQLAGIRGLRAAAGFVMLALVAPGGALRGQATSYLDFDGLTRELRSLVDGSNLATMRSLGTSREGREIWLVEIRNPSGTPVDTRPGLLIVGNLEGDHLVGSALALETIRYLIDQNGGEANLDEQVVYVVPRLNPDGAEAMFAAVHHARRGNARPYDDDNDGRIDEDPPEDLNGDGFITVMRVPDPSGDYIIHPDDARLMKRADAGEGESGAYTLYREGRDSDGDGFLNEDGAGGVDLNRNFQHAYPYYERDAGPHMVSESEARALMDFVVAQRNIGAILTFGHSDNLVTAPNASGGLAGPKILDLPAFADASNADVFDKGVFRTQGRGFGGGGFGGGGGGQPRLRGAQRDGGRRPPSTARTCSTSRPSPKPMGRSPASRGWESTARPRGRSSNTATSSLASHRSVRRAGACPSPNRTSREPVKGEVGEAGVERMAPMPPFSRRSRAQASTRSWTGHRSITRISVMWRSAASACPPS